MNMGSSFFAEKTTKQVLKRKANPALSYRWNHFYILTLLTNLPCCSNNSLSYAAEKQTYRHAPTGSILYCFQDTAKYWWKIANFAIPHLCLTHPTKNARSEFWLENTSKYKREYQTSKEKTRRMEQPGGWEQWDYKFCCTDTHITRVW